MKCEEIAHRITAHLRRFEKNPVINADRPDHGNTAPYLHAFASHSGRWVYVQYLSYQGDNALTKQEAMRYLEWLDAGNVGKHWEAKP